MDNFTRLESFPSVGPQPAARINHPLPYPGGPVLELDRQLRRLIALISQLAVTVEDRHKASNASLAESTDSLQARINHVSTNITSLVNDFRSRTHEELDALRENTAESFQLLGSSLETDIADLRSTDAILLAEIDSASTALKTALSQSQALLQSLISSEADRSRRELDVLRSMHTASRTELAASLETLSKALDSGFDVLLDNLITTTRSLRDQLHALDAASVERHEALLEAVTSSLQSLTSLHGSLYKALDARIDRSTQETQALCRDIYTQLGKHLDFTRTDLTSQIKVSTDAILEEMVMTRNTLSARINVVESHLWHLFWRSAWQWFASLFTGRPS